MIQLNEVTKCFNKVRAVNKVTVNIRRNECTALVGINGAGKSTLIDLVIGNKHSDKGTITADFDLKQNTGILYQKTEFPQLIKVKELYGLYKSLYVNYLSLEEFKRITRFNNHQMNQYASKLSGGQQRILDFALAVIGNPQLIILDEPTASMDATLRRHFWELIQTYKEDGKTILYTTHFLEEVEKMADRVLVMRKGEIMNDNNPASIRQQTKTSIIHVPVKYRSVCTQVAFESIQINKKEILIETEDVESSIFKLINLNINLNEIEISKVSLEDFIFESEVFVS